MVTCAAPSYLQQYERPETLRIWINIGQLTFLATTVVTYGMEVYRKREHCFATSCGQPLVDNSDILLSCALAGLGIIQLPMMPLLPILLPALLKRFCPIPIGVKARVSDVSRQALPFPKVRVFIDWFSDVLATQIRWAGGLLMDN